MFNVTTVVKNTSPNNLGFSTNIFLERQFNQKTIIPEEQNTAQKGDNVAMVMRVTGATEKPFGTKWVVKSVWVTVN